MNESFNPEDVTDQGRPTHRDLTTQLARRQSSLGLRFLTKIQWPRLAQHHVKPARQA
jgi:hypothetical protein